MIFIKDVRLVEIEIHSYCNRKCEWCPNKFIDRSFKQYLNEEIYIKTLNNLKNTKYNGVMSYSRYNEPMALPELLKERVRQAKQILPDVKLVSNTNGDFLSKKNLNGLLLDELTIMDYQCIGLENCLKKLNDVDVNIISIKDSKFIYAEKNDIKILYYVNWPKYAKIEDRGGSLLEYQDNKRFRPCLEPTYFIGIDYNGNVMPCCHMRSDNKFHEQYILGNIYKQKLSKIYNSNKSQNIRLNAKTCPEKLNPCTYCTKEMGRYTKDINAEIDY